MSGAAIGLRLGLGLNLCCAPAHAVKNFGGTCPRQLNYEYKRSTLMENIPVIQQEAQLMLTTGSTRLAVTENQGIEQSSTSLFITVGRRLQF